MARFIEIALFTPTVAEHTDFYQRLLGIEPHIEEEGMSEFHFGLLTLRIHVSDNPPPRNQPSGGVPPDEDHFAFGVEDLDELVRMAKERGIAFEIEPTDFDWGRSAYLRDPDGRLVELSQLPR